MELRHAPPTWPQFRKRPFATATAFWMLMVAGNVFLNASAVAAEPLFRITVSPTGIMEQIKLKDSKDWTLSAAVPPDQFYVVKNIDFDPSTLSGYERPSMAAKSNATQSGDFSISVFFISGELEPENWRKLTQDPRIIKFDYGSPEQLFEYAAFSNFELVKRIAGSVTSSSDSVVNERFRAARVEEVGKRTAQILFHHVRFWNHISALDDFPVAPEPTRFRALVKLLDDYSSVAERNPESNGGYDWFYDNLRIKYRDIREVIGLARGSIATQYQAAKDRILTYSCQDQALLFERLAKSFQGLSNSERNLVAYNMDRKQRLPSQWAAWIAETIADRKARFASGIGCEDGK